MLPEGPSGGDSPPGLWGRVCPGRKPQGIPSQPPLAHLLTTPAAEPLAPGRCQKRLLGSLLQPRWPGQFLPYLLVCLRMAPSAPGRILRCIQVAQPSPSATSWPTYPETLPVSGRLRSNETASKGEGLDGTGHLIGCHGLLHGMIL